MIEMIKEKRHCNPSGIRSDKCLSSFSQYILYHLDDLFSENEAGQD